MSEEAQAPTAPAEGPLSFDQAVSSLLPREPEKAPAAEPEAAPEATPSEAEPTAEDQPVEPEAANDGEEQAEQPEPETPAIEPPRFWDAEAKAKFRELSPEHQAIVLAQAEKGVQASAKAIQEAAERAKQAEQQVQGINALAQELSEFLPRATEIFKSRWDGVDWVQLAQEDPGQYVALKAQHDAETVELERVKAANQRAQEEAKAAFVRQEHAALATHAPALLDPVKGPERQKELASYLKTVGASDEDLAGLTALAAGVAYKAMLYDRAKANPAKPVAPPSAPPARVVTPTASPAQSPQQRAAVSVQNRFNAKPSVDNAIALLLSKKA